MPDSQASLSSLKGGGAQAGGGGSSGGILGGILGCSASWASAAAMWGREAAQRRPGTGGRRPDPYGSRDERREVMATSYYGGRRPQLRLRPAYGTPRVGLMAWKNDWKNLNADKIARLPRRTPTHSGPRQDVEEWPKAHTST